MKLLTFYWLLNIPVIFVSALSDVNDERLEIDAGSHFDPDMVDVFLSILPEILDIKKHWDAKVKAQ